MLPGKTRLAAKIIKMLSLIWIIPCVIIAALWIKGRIEFVYDSFEKDSAAALQNLRIETASNAARIDTSASSALSQREFVRFCTSDMDADGLQLVKFSQNELKTIRSIFQSNDIIEEASFFFDNPQIHEIWPTIYRLDRLKNTPFDEIIPSGQSAVYAVEDGEVYGCYRIYLDITPVGLLRLRLDSDKFFSGFSNANAASCLLAANGELFSNEENLFSAEELQAVLTDSPDTPSRSTYQAVLEKDGRSYLVRYSWLELLNAWAVVYEDQADLLQPVYQMGASVLAVMLLGMCMAEPYGEEAVEKYAADPDSTAFNCYFLGGVEKFVMNGDTITGLDAQGQEVFAHTYQKLDVDNENSFLFYQSEDADSGEFTYFAFAPDTMETTYHLEFRYAEDLDDLQSWYEGNYAYWNAAAIAEDYDQATMENVIELFVTENLSEAE